MQSTDYRPVVILAIIQSTNRLQTSHSSRSTSSAVAEKPRDALYLPTTCVFQVQHSVPCERALCIRTTIFELNDSWPGYLAWRLYLTLSMFEG